MKISVAMTTYNGEQYILKQLISIYNQTCKVDEVVIFDDCSSDNTVNIIENFIKENKLDTWKLYKNSDNVGYISNFNNAINMTSGDIIFLCDQDDIWLEDKVKYIVNIFFNYKECYSVATNFKLINENDEFYVHDNTGDNPWFNDMSKSIGKKLYRVTLSEALTHCISPGCTQAFRRDLVDEFLSFDFKLAHDNKIGILAALKNGFFYYDENLTLYRKHSHNTSGYPNYVLYRRKRKYHKIFMYYVLYTYRFIINLVSKNVRDNYYNSNEYIAYLDNLNKTDSIINEYNNWREYSINRTKLYNESTNRRDFYKKQKTLYKKMYNLECSTGDNIERYKIRGYDFVQSLKK